MEYFKHVKDEEEKLRLPKRLENYKVRHQEIVPCGYCGNLNDIHDMARGTDPLTRDAWFDSPDCEARYMEDEETYLPFFSDIENLSPEDYADFMSDQIDQAKDEVEDRQIREQGL